jgi:hypothetical protein
MIELTVLRLQQVLEYAPTSGEWHWKRRSDVRGGWNSKCAGKIAGRLDSDGYRQIAVDGRRYSAARLAWLYMTGEWPPDEIDHKNRRRDDDRWENLRAVTHVQNMANVGLPSTNTSGIKGVYWNKKLGKWQAALARQHLGVFDDINEAAADYQAAAARRVPLTYR